MKHLGLLKQFLLLFALIVESTSVWGQNTVTFVAGTDTSEGTSITKGGITVSFSEGSFNRADNYRCYSGASMTISSTVGNMTQIDFEATSSNPMTKFSGNPDVGAWTDTSTKVQWTGNSTEINFGKTSGQTRITKITVTYTPSGDTPTPVTHNVTLPVENEFGSYTMDATNPVTVGTEVNLTYTPATGYENYEAAWSINGTAIAGNKFTMPDEDVTVTVAVAEVADYVTLPFEWNGGTSAQLQAVQGITASGLGTDYADSNAPYRVKLDNTGDYIQIKTASQPGKVTIGVKMIGGGSASSIKVQGSADGTNFTDVETLSINGSQNDVLTLVTKNSFAATDRYVRLLFTKGSNVGVGPIKIEIPSTDPEIVAAETVSLAADATSGEIAYTIVNPISGTNLEATSEANWISNISVEPEKVSFTTTANTTGAERSATITLTYGSVIKNITVTQAKPVVMVNYTLATAVVPGKHYIITSGKDGEILALGKQATNYNYREQVSVTAANGSLSVEDNAGVSEFLINVDNATGFYTLYDVAEEKYLFANSNSSNNINVEDQLDNKNNGVWAIEISSDGVATIKAQGANERNWIRYNSGSSRFSCYGETNSMADVYLFERDNDDSPVQTTITVSPATDKTYTTFCRAIDLDFTNVSGIEAYVVSGLTESSASIKKVNKVPAGEGIILKRTGTDESFDIPFAESAEPIAKNYMVGVTKEKDMTNVTNAYILSGGLFYECSGGKLAAGKAYLNDKDGVWAAAAGAPSFSIIVDGETTGIENVKGEAITNSQYYTLDGRRVAAPTKGIYIVNGKKVVVK